ncbi:hypothetical protein Tco_1386817 [Tanacetum coccineum]
MSSLAEQEANRTLGPIVESESENEDDNENGNGGGRRNERGGRRNDGNGNGGRNGNNRNNNNGNGDQRDNMGGAKMIARECTYKKFLNCQSFNFKVTKEAVGLARWFKKMESGFHISNCPPKYQVKYASCTLQNNALTWNEIQKVESELWNLTVKGNDLTAYTQRFQELILLCPKMVPEEEDRVKRYIWGLLDNIQGNVTTSVPKRLQDVVRMASGLMDQKIVKIRLLSIIRGLQWEIKEPQGVIKELQGVIRGKMSRVMSAGDKAISVVTAQNLKNQNQGNQAATAEARGRAFALGRREVNKDSNVVMGTFLFNNRYAYMLFDSGADRSFISTTFSSLMDVPPTTLDNSYAIELADGGIVESNIILRGSRSPYRLSPSEMQELSTQLQELAKV